MFKEVNCKVSAGGFPYVPMCIKSPYYFFVGQKEDDGSVRMSSDSISSNGSSNSAKTTARKRVRQKSKNRQSK